MTDQRKHMNPDHLDKLLFLRYNKNLWNVVTVQDATNTNQTLTTSSTTSESKDQEVTSNETKVQEVAPNDLDNEVEDAQEEEEEDTYY